MNKKAIFISIIILQLIFLSIMTFFHMSKINTATSILLETEPVDPFSVFRGRYINLNYKISNISANLLKDCKYRDLKSNDYIYVVLEKKGEFWEPTAAYKNKPQETDLIFLKGKVRYPSPNIRVKYGIESFFLSEKSADEIDKKVRGGRRNWQEIQKLRKAQMEKLSVEDKRMHKAGLTEQWFRKLDKETDYWLEEGIIDQETASRIKNKYAKALERIKVAQQVEPQGAERQLNSLTIEVAVAKDGSGYPTKLFWEGKEYR